jgi:hypothetical protein
VVVMQRSRPAAAKADHRPAAGLALANHRLDTRIQSRNIAAAGENADTRR